MLKSIRIQNFKILRDTKELLIKPLTFLVGPNSSGKTSLFQLMLALRQTNQCMMSYPLLLRGEYLDIGTYKDIIFNHEEKRNLKVSLTFDERISNKRFQKKFDFEFTYQKKEGHGKIFLKSIDYSGPFKFEEFIDFAGRSDSRELSEMETREWDLPDAKIRIVRKSKTNHFELKFIMPKEVMNKKVDVMIINFHNITKVKRGPLFPLEFFELSEIVDRFFYTLFHIGPLRQEPWRVYSSSGITPIEVGKTGNRAIDALIVRKGLLEFINDWLERFNIASDIKVEELKEGSERYEIIIKDINTGIDVNLADVGFGVSQLLPVILEFIVTPDVSTVMVEQPEIHLHPKAQALIGELLVDVAVKRKDMKFIIETHSDLLLSRICTLIAEGKFKKENVVIYYFDPTPRGTKIKEITISEDGQYEKFPKGFFSERYEEAWRKSEAILKK